jgi:hypothetical protein
MEAESNWMEVGCYSQVTLKFVLEDDIIKTACCQQLDKEGCVISSVDIQGVVCWNQQDLIESIPPSVGDCYLLTTPGDPGCEDCGPGPGLDPCNDWADHPLEIACWTVEGTWSYSVPEENTIITDVNTGDEWIYTAQNGWQILNSLDCTPGQYNLLITGYVLSTIVSGYLYYKKSADPFYILHGIFTGQQLGLGVNITGLDPCTNWDIKILGLSNNCDYGEGPVENCTTLTDPTC